MPDLLLESAAKRKRPLTNRYALALSAMLLEMRR
jgi:hypothetical protein